MGSILLVEADPQVCDQWATALGAKGHAVHTAAQTRDALPMVRDGGIDVVIVDAYDPRIGTVDLARSIASLPDAPPLILVSGSPHAPELSARMGAVAFVPKPCDAAEIVATVERVVGAPRPVRIVEDEPTTRTRVG
ncbi:MAG: response regulator [Kofleriaceae bacterium]